MSKLNFVAACRLPTEWGVFTLHGFEDENGQEHVALTMGDVSDGLPSIFLFNAQNLQHQNICPSFSALVCR